MNTPRLRRIDAKKVTCHSPGCPIMDRASGFAPALRRLQEAPERGTNCKGEQTMLCKHNKSRQIKWATPEQGECCEICLSNIGFHHQHLIIACRFCKYTVTWMDTRYDQLEVSGFSGRWFDMEYQSQMQL